MNENEDLTTDRYEINKQQEQIIKELEDALIEADEALKSISCDHKPSLHSEEQWLSKSHKDCAIVLATDTKIARQTREKLKPILEAINNE